MAQKKKTEVQKAFSEVKKNPPRVLAKTKKKFGKSQAEKQRVAIALSKARKAGAKIPKVSKKEKVLSRMKQRSQE